MTEAAPARRRLTARAQPVLLALGLVGLVIAVVGLRDDLDRDALPNTGTLLAVLALSLVSLMASARAWVRLVDPGAAKRQVIDALYASQLTKYLPAGGIVQAAGQISLSTGEGRSASRVSVAYVLSMATVVAGGLAVSALLVTVSSAPAWLRWGALLGLLAPLLLAPPVLRTVLGVGHRRFARIPGPDAVPGARVIAAALAWSTLNIGTLALAFAITVRSIEPGTPTIGAIAAFSLAWVAGFLVLPVPSGLGIREAVMIAALPGVPVAALLAASLTQRLTSLVAEILLAGSGLIRRARRRKLDRRAASTH